MLIGGGNMKRHSKIISLKKWKEKERIKLLTPYEIALLIKKALRKEKLIKKGELLNNIVVILVVSILIFALLLGLVPCIL